MGELAVLDVVELDLALVVRDVRFEETLERLEVRVRPGLRLATCLELTTRFSQGGRGRGELLREVASLSDGGVTFRSELLTICTRKINVSGELFKAKLRTCG